MQWWEEKVGEYFHPNEYHLIQVPFFFLIIFIFLEIYNFCLFTPYLLPPPCATSKFWQAGNGAIHEAVC